MQNVTNEGKLGEGYMGYLCTIFAFLYYYYESVIISKLKDKKLWIIITLIILEMRKSSCFCLKFLKFILQQEWKLTHI